MYISFYFLSFRHLQNGVKTNILTVAGNLYFLITYAQIH